MEYQNSSRDPRPYSSAAQMTPTNHRSPLSSPAKSVADAFAHLFDVAGQGQGQKPTVYSYGQSPDDHTLALRVESQFRDHALKIASPKPRDEEDIITTPWKYETDRITPSPLGAYTDTTHGHIGTACYYPYYPPDTDAIPHPGHTGSSGDKSKDGRGSTRNQATEESGAGQGQMDNPRLPAYEEQLVRKLEDKFKQRLGYSSQLSSPQDQQQQRRYGYGKQDERSRENQLQSMCYRMAGVLRTKTDPSDWDKNSILVMCDHPSFSPNGTEVCEAYSNAQTRGGNRTETSVQVHHSVRGDSQQTSWNMVQAIQAVQWKPNQPGAETERREPRPEPQRRWTVGPQSQSTSQQRESSQESKTPGLKSILKKNASQVSPRPESNSLPYTQASTGCDSPRRNLPSDQYQYQDRRYDPRGQDPHAYTATAMQSSQGPSGPGSTSVGPMRRASLQQATGAGPMSAYGDGYGPHAHGLPVGSPPPYSPGGQQQPRNPFDLYDQYGRDEQSRNQQQQYNQHDLSQNMSNLTLDPTAATQHREQRYYTKDYADPRNRQPAQTANRDWHYDQPQDRAQRTYVSRHQDDGRREGERDYRIRYEERQPKYAPSESQDSRGPETSISTALVPRKADRESESESEQRRGSHRDRRQSSHDDRRTSVVKKDSGRSRRRQSSAHRGEKASSGHRRNRSPSRSRSPSRDSGSGKRMYLVKGSDIRSGSRGTAVRKVSSRRSHSRAPSRPESEAESECGSETEWESDREKSHRRHKHHRRYEKPGTSGRSNSRLESVLKGTVKVLGEVLKDRR